MNNCLVMGFGRSGTSLMGGILNDAGYFLGENLYPPRDSNPKGFFENDFINGINEHILETYNITQLHNQIQFVDKPLSPFKPGYGQRWLMYLPTEIPVTKVIPQIGKEITIAIQHKNFAYKDPRFNYTLRAWLPFLDQKTIFICMFREPGITLSSVLKECNTADYLRDFYIDTDLAEKIWCLSYSHLLEAVKYIGLSRFHFIHYRQLLMGEALSYLSDALDTTLNGQFTDIILNRTSSSINVKTDTGTLYQRLCELAGFKT